MFAQTMARQRQMEDERNYEQVRWQREREAKREDALQPRVEQVGDAVGMLNPQSQTFEPFYTRPQPFEAYARAQGFEAGSPEYAAAVEDYRLGSWSDPAMENRTALEGVRGDERSALETLRSAARLRELNARLGVTRRGQDLTQRGRAADRTQRGTLAGQADARIRGGASYQGVTRGRSAAGGSNAARAINPKTGQAIVFENGHWVDERTRQPVK